MEKLSWLDESISSEYSFSYWNDESKERGKIFDEVNFHRLETDEHLNNIYSDVIVALESKGINLQGKSLLSLASGTCWLESRLLKLESFELKAVDFSRHRIHDLAPKTLEYFDLGTEDISLVHGDILSLELSNNTQDIVLLSQAFHHTNQPIQLLGEIKRVLKDNGVVIIVGEHYYNLRTKVKRVVSHIKKWTLDDDYKNSHSLVPDYSALFPPCFQKGDIHYSKSDYHFLFSGLGFDYTHFVNRKGGTQSFVLSKTVH